MEKFLYPTELKTKWNVNDVELLECVINELPAYDSRNPSNRLEVVEEAGKIYFKKTDSTYYPDFVPSGFSNWIKDFSKPRETAFYVISENLCVFKLSQVEAFEEAHPELIKGERKSDSEFLEGEEPSKENPTVDHSNFSHSEDFRSVSKDGKEFTLTTKQAGVIEALYNARQDNKESSGYLSQEHILDKAGSDGKRLRDLFRSNIDVWKSVIERHPERRGLFRLKV